METIKRRHFLKTGVAGLGSVPLFISAKTLGRENGSGANDTIHVGCIGIGPQGTGVMRQFLRNEHARVIALSDVKSNVLKDREEMVNNFYENEDCQTYPDFLDLVARKDIDAVLVATCDHWHVLTSLAAVRSGKDVYMEKPMGLALEEDQVMRQAVHQHKRVFQFGTQQRSDANFRRACEIVRNGFIGELKTIRVWSPGSAQGGSGETVPVPEWLDYNRWLGPAPYTPYTEKRCSNELWWFISDYALGFIAGWGIHPIDIALWGGEEHFQGPWKVEGTGEFPSQGVCDTAMHWHVDIELGSGVKIEFLGPRIPQDWKERYQDESTHGTAFEGSDGWVFVRRGRIACSKDLDKMEIKDPLYESHHHVNNFVDCIRSRKQTVSHVDAAVTGDTLCHISDIAIRMGKKLVFDPENEIFLDDDKANQRLKSTMRKPWSLYT